MAKVTIDSGALQSLLRSPTGPVMRHISSLASRVATRAPQLARRKTGRLHSSMRIRQETDGAGPFYRVIAEVPYAMAEHEGARPHIIRPTNSAALHFFWERAGLQTIVPRGGGFRTHIGRGGILFIGKGYVEHPGTTGTKFLTRALEDVIRGGA